MNRITALAATAAARRQRARPHRSGRAGSAPAEGARLRGDGHGQHDVAIGKETILKVRGRVTPKAAGQKVVLQQRVGNKKTLGGHRQHQDQGQRHLQAHGQAVDGGRPRVPRRQARLERHGEGLQRARSTSRSTAGRSSPTAPRWRPDSPCTRRDHRHRVLRPQPGDRHARARRRPSSTPSAASAPRCGRRTPSPTSRPPARAARSASRADGSRLASHPLAVGTVVEDEELDLTGVFRLKFDATTSATPAADRRRRDARGALHALTAHPVRSGGHDRGHRPGRARRCA